MKRQNFERRPDIEAFVKQSLIEDGWDQNEFGTVIADLKDGTSMNMTLVIAQVIQEYLEAQPPQSRVKEKRV